MLLLRGATDILVYASDSLWFQYMLLLRGATMVLDLIQSLIKGFNTCSSCEEQHVRICLAPLRTVSIHAPLARSNPRPQASSPDQSFQYMLLLRGATPEFIKGLLGT